MTGADVAPVDHKGAVARAAAPLYRMTPLEVAWGWLDTEPVGAAAVCPGRPEEPVAALERAIRPALLRPPCVVQFSGGRDSSLVLAVALRLARREGLAEPIARTHRFPGLAETAEDEWQERVARHLGVREWQRVDLDDELDLVGPVAGPSLRRHGMLWPPLVHVRHFDFGDISGGALVDGEGGDEVLGPGRMAPLQHVLARRRLPTVAALKRVGFSLSPRPLRRVGARRWYEHQLRPPWLRPDAWRALRSVLAQELAGEPMDRRRALARHGRLRAVSLFRSNTAALGDEHGVLVVHPLLEPTVLAAIGAAGGRRGFPSRSSAMTSLFAGLLPDDVLRRADKARFNRSAFSTHSRAFAAHWDGRGVDDALVDPELLAGAWKTREPSAMSFALLQSAWLASR